MKVASLFTGLGGLDLGYDPRFPASRLTRPLEIWNTSRPRPTSTRSLASIDAENRADPPPDFPRDALRSLEQAGHEIILQVESDDRCASVLRTQFPRARLSRNLHALRQLPAETEVLAATLPWPEEEDDDAKARAAVEHPWLPASRAAATQEHAHFFRLLATRPVSWVVLELPVSLLRWATAAVPGTRPFGFLFSRRTRAFAFFASPAGRANAATRARDLRVGEFRDERAHRFPRDGPRLTSPSPHSPPLSPLICSSASADRQRGQRTGDVKLPLGVPRRGPARCVPF